MKTSQTGRRFPLRWLIFLLLAVPGLYVVRQLVTVVTPSYTYETAVLSTMADSIELEGLVLFDETVVTHAGANEYGYLIDDGERVSAGTAVAEIYTSAEQSGVRTKLQNVEAQIALLQKSQNTSASNVDTLIAQRSTAMYDLLDGLDRVELETLQTNKENYLTAQNKLQITTGEAVDFNDRIQELKAERESLTAQLGSPEKIYAPGGGYFTGAQNASFLRAGKAELLELTPQALAEQLEQGTVQEPENAVGKIVSSYQWYFYGSCTLEQAARFADVKSVSICFPGKAEDALPATVVSVVTDEESGLAAVTLKCEYIGADILCLGQETAQIIFKSYTGIRVSSDAIRMVKEEVQIAQSGSGEDEEESVVNSETYVQGVYVKHGNVAKFRRITKLYEGSGYILVPVNGKVGTENEVRMYDEVIVEGTDLYDGKLL